MWRVSSTLTHITFLAPPSGHNQRDLQAETTQVNLSSLALYYGLSYVWSVEKTDASSLTNFQRSLHVMDDVLTIWNGKLLYFTVLTTWTISKTAWWLSSIFNHWLHFRSVTVLTIVQRSEIEITPIRFNIANVRPFLTTFCEPTP